MSGHVKLASLRDDLSHFDALFIDVQHVGIDNLHDKLVRWHRKPTKNIVVYNYDILNSTWTEDEMQNVGDIIDLFMEYHVRWQIYSEPYVNKTSNDWQDNVFILRGETQKAWDLIQKHQFPQNCTNQNYFVSKYWENGWGSYMAVTHRTLEFTTQVSHSAISQMSD